MSTDSADARVVLSEGMDTAAAGTHRDDQHLSRDVAARMRALLKISTTGPSKTRRTAGLLGTLSLLNSWPLSGTPWLPIIHTFEDHALCPLTRL